MLNILMIVGLAIAAITVISVAFHFSPFSTRGRFYKLLAKAEAGDNNAYNILGWSKPNRHTSWALWFTRHITNPKTIERVKAMNVALGEYRASVDLQEETSKVARQRFLWAEAEVKVRTKFYKLIRDGLDAVNEATDPEASIMTRLALLTVWQKGIRGMMHQAYRIYPTASWSDLRLFSWEEFSAETVRQIKHHIEGLTDSALDESTTWTERRQAYTQLHTFWITITKVPANGHSLCYEAGLSNNHWPARWNTIMAIYIENPMPGDVLVRSWTPGQISLEAAEAVRTGDIVQAKVVMAYVKADHGKRTELGDDLWAELISFIEAENARLRTEQTNSANPGDQA